MLISNIFIISLVRTNLCVAKSFAAANDTYGTQCLEANND